MRRCFHPELPSCAGGLGACYAAQRGARGAAPARMREAQFAISIVQHVQDDGTCPARAAAQVGRHRYVGARATPAAEGQNRPRAYRSASAD